MTMKTSSKKWQKIRKIKGLRQFVTWYPRHVSENPGKKKEFMAAMGIWRAAANVYDR